MHSIPDVHFWSISGNDVVGTVHILLQPDALWPQVKRLVDNVVAYDINEFELNELTKKSYDPGEIPLEPSRIRRRNFSNKNIIVQIAHASESGRALPPPPSIGLL